MSGELLLEIRGLVTTFRNGSEVFNAIDDVSLKLHKGQTIGIVGESGSGKSVTSLSVMRLIPEPPGKITSGKIEYHKGEEIIDLARTDEKTLRDLRGKEIAMIFQEPMTSLNPVLTCGEQVQEAILLHQKISKKEARWKTVELFAEVQLPDPERLFERYPHEISGGQKQRVMIAMAMSCNPKVIIADEPTTALDVTVQKTILQLLRRLQEKYGLGLLFITHDLGVIAELATDVLVMYKGKIVEQGKVQQVFSAPRHPYTKSLLACRPPVNFRLKKLPVVSDFIKRDAGGSIIPVPATEKFIPQRESSEDRTEGHKLLYEGTKILEVKNLCTWFPAGKSVFGKTLDYVKAVDNVSFDVYEGETLGLVGESGCGKSTLGRTILKLINATSGEVRFEGENILPLSEKEFRPLRTKMQLIFQDPYSSLNPRMNIGSAILEPMRVHGIGREDADRKKLVMELLTKVGLEQKFYYRYPHEFSGGQRQRICIARALALKPKFIVCDESVSALDVSVQAQVLNLLNSLKKEFRFTYIFISHDLGVVKFMSDRMIVMQKGRIVEMGDPDVIYRDPKNEYTKKLIDSIPKIEVNLSE